MSITEAYDVTNFEQYKNNGIILLRQVCWQNYVIAIRLFSMLQFLLMPKSCRLASKSVLANLSRFPTTLSTAQFAQAAAGAPKLTFKKFEPPVQEHHDVRNEKLNRPLSPHLTIYRFQLTATLSITHRATGMVPSIFIAFFISHWSNIKTFSLFYVVVIRCW